MVGKRGTARATLAFALSRLVFRDIRDFRHELWAEIERGDDILLERVAARKLRHSQFGGGTANNDALLALMDATFDGASAAPNALRVPGPPWLHPAVRCVLHAEDAAALVRSCAHPAAITKYIQAARELVGPQVLLPSTEFMNGQYREWEQEYETGPIVELAVCFNGIARSYIAMGNKTEALKWLQETEMLFENQRKVLKKDQLAWIDYHINLEDHFLERLTMYDLYSTVFAELGNTGAAAWYALQRQCWASYAEIQTIVRRFRDAVEKMQLRHPEPTFVDKQRVSEPELQLRGAWTKLKTIGAGPPSRLSNAFFIWRSRLYIFAGRTHTERSRSPQPLLLKDLWCLELNPIGSWRRLPDHPETRPLLDTTMRAHGERVYLFQGRKTYIWVFDLVREEWYKQPTTWRGGAWPYLNDDCDECALEVLDGVLYAFGGTDRRSDLGTNIFMTLDLSTYEWTHLGGVSHAVPTIRTPDLRRLPASWTVPAEKRIYIMYGHANRSAALLSSKPHGNDDDFQYGDVWSYDVVGRTWRQERRDGNFPAPRTEMAGAWNPRVRRVCTYGGYNPTMMSPPGGPSTDHRAQGQQAMFNFTYFGDTFVWSPDTRSWQQVMTRGFPSYRARANMVVDETPGKTYLFGGYVYTNAAFVPSDKYVFTRTFNDVWQFLLDTPGGHFDDTDLRTDTDAPRMGPWKRCFACGAVGSEWKKCGGLCGGTVFFCATDCLKQGWAEHKKAHKCRKG